MMMGRIYRVAGGLLMLLVLVPVQWMEHDGIPLGAGALLALGMLGAAALLLYLGGGTVIPPPKGTKKAPEPLTQARTHAPRRMQNEEQAQYTTRKR